MLPTGNATLRAGRALILDCAFAKDVCPVAPERQPFLLVRKVVFQLLAGRADMDILVRLILEVGFDDATSVLVVCRLPLGQRHFDAGFLTS